MCATHLPSIAYVDEQEDERSNFYMDAHDSGLFAEIFLVEAFPTLEETAAVVLDLGIDALVTDFKLSEQGRLPYTGEDIVEAILAVRQGFPCFVRTSFEPDALSVSTDVNRVYSKDAAAEEHTAGSIFTRIDLQIKKHQHFLDRCRGELEQLLKLGDADRDAEQVSRILELDHLLEASFGADAAISKEVKLQVLGRRNELHDQAAQLIEDLKKKLGDLD